MCINNLPKVITWHCTSPESKLQPQDYKFSKLPLHHQAAVVVVVVVVEVVVVVSDKTLI